MNHGYHNCNVRHSVPTLLLLWDIEEVRKHERCGSIDENKKADSESHTHVVRDKIAIRNILGDIRINQGIGAHRKNLLGLDSDTRRIALVLMDQFPASQLPE
jgi:hypothetical protein